MRRERAFTLFEVLISIAIFLLLAGGIFASVSAAFKASTQVAAGQLDAERADAFQQLLRTFFLSLPAETKVELRLRKETGKGDVVELLAWPVPAFLQFGTNASDGIAIAGLPDGRGNFRVSLGYFHADDPPDKRDRRLEQEKWLTLLPDVSEIKWRFAPSRNPVMVEMWNAGSGRPGLAELTLKMANGDGGVFNYWIPPLQYRSSGGGEPAGETSGEETPPAPPSSGVPTPSTEGEQ
jgi:prepilin-type N-terminal cleavage/methylation domain-containing protein